MEGWDLGMAWGQGLCSEMESSTDCSPWRKQLQERLWVSFSLDPKSDSVPQLSFGWVSGLIVAYHQMWTFSFAVSGVGKYQSCRSFCVLPIVTNQSWQIWEVPKFGTSIFDRTFSQFFAGQRDWDSFASPRNISRLKRFQRPQWVGDILRVL